MRVSIYAQITLKDKPKGFLGMTGESISLGKNDTIDFNVMVIQLLRRLADYYSIFMTPDELNRQLDNIVEFCQLARFKESTIDGANIVD